MILNFYGSVVPSGTYTTIIAHSQVQINNGVRFTTLIVKDNAVFNCNEAGNLILEGGLVHCTHDLHCRNISGHGRLSIKGNLQCASVTDFTGTIRAKAMHCSASLSIRGLIKTRLMNIDETATITGHVTAQNLCAEHLTVSMFETTMLPRFRMGAYSKRSSIGTIQGSRVTVQAVTCDAIYADAVTLQKGSYAQCVFYGNDLEYDQTSYASLIQRSTHRHQAYTPNRFNGDGEIQTMYALEDEDPDEWPQEA